LIGICCLTQNYDTTLSCDPTGLTSSFVSITAGKADALTDSTWSSGQYKQLEVAFLACPNDDRLCGTTAKVSTLTIGTELNLKMGTLSIS
jgi:hypothetical protein